MPFDAKLGLTYSGGLAVRGCEACLAVYWPSAALLQLAMQACMAGTAAAWLMVPRAVLSCLLLHLDINAWPKGC